MAHKFFTGDFHLGASGLMALEKWPFNSIEEHDNALINMCINMTKPDDIIYHLGDVAQYGNDGHYLDNSKGLTIKPSVLIKNIPAAFVNIRGNHDLHNKIKSLCESMTIFLSKRYPNISMSHYPTYDIRIDRSCLAAPIHLCAHVHNAWKHCLDLDHRILNINVGCMAWNFKLVSDDELITYLNQLFKKKPEELFRCKKSLSGKPMFMR